MKRFAAAVIDVLLIEIISTVVYCVVLSIWRICRNAAMRYMGSSSRVWLLVVYIIILACVNFVYFFFFERKKNGGSVGKCIMRMKKQENVEKSIGNSLLIAGLKTIACFLYPITIGYYFYFYRMPYDGLRKEE